MSEIKKKQFSFQWVSSPSSRPHAFSQKASIAWVVRTVLYSFQSKQKCLTKYSARKKEISVVRNIEFVFYFIKDLIFENS